MIRSEIKATATQTCPLLFPSVGYKKKTKIIHFKLYNFQYYSKYPQALMGRLDN
jgi:hypothetical protein